MAKVVTLKVYNKSNKLKFLFRDTYFTKTASIYKYNGEIIDTHSFTYSKKGKLKPWQAYYEMTIDVNGVLLENIIVSDDFIEHYEYNSDMSTTRTTTNLKSGNVYENRVKYFKGEKYQVEFLNDQFNDIHFQIKEKKINEYLKK